MIPPSGQSFERCTIQSYGSRSSIEPIKMSKTGYKCAKATTCSYERSSSSLARAVDDHSRFRLRTDKQTDERHLEEVFVVELYLSKITSM